MKSRQLVETPALILHRVPFSEADWVTSLFTRDCGKVSAVTPGARKSKRRYVGGLEPFHSLSVRLLGSSRGEMFHLESSEIARPRHNLVASLNAMSSAAIALGWLRRALPAMQPDGSAWSLTEAWLDRLDTTVPTNSRLAEARAAEFGFRLLAILGWGLQLRRCVRCDKDCPPERSAYLVLSAGGIVCRACGGAGLIIESSLRKQMLCSGEDQYLTEDASVKALRIVEAAFASHAGIER